MRPDASRIRLRGLIWEWNEDERASWPEGMRRCTECHELCPIEAFHKSPGSSKSGRRGDCRDCRRKASSETYAQRPREQKMVDRAKRRAKAKGVPFALTAEDVHVPTHCPVLGIELCADTNKKAHGPDSPSLDRLIPELGYVPGNVTVISNRANTLKRDATADELEAVASWVRQTTRYSSCMARNMPGTPKARSVSRPAQGKGKRAASAGRPRSLRPVKSTPTWTPAVARTGSLDVS